MLSAGCSNSAANDHFTESFLFLKHFSPSKKRYVMSGPSYVTRPNIRRVIIPIALQTLLLCIIFFISFQLNVRLFVKYRVLATYPPSVVSFAVAGVLFLLFCIELLNTYRKYTVMVYDFYPDRIELYGKKPNIVQLAVVTDIRLKQNVFDTFFKTGTILIKPTFSIEHVAEPQEVLAYVQRLVDHTRQQAGGRYPQQQYTQPTGQFQGYSY